MGRADDLIETEKEIRKRIERRYHKRVEFFQMLIALGVINAGLWTVLGPGGVAQCFAAISVMAVAMQGIDLLLSELKEGAIQREIEAERLARGYIYTDASVKAKRGSPRPAERLVRLSDDGELIELGDDPEYDEDEDDARGQRRR
jgi:hypothetical protein